MDNLLDTGERKSRIAEEEEDLSQTKTRLARAEDYALPMIDAVTIDCRLSYLENQLMEVESTLNILQGKS